MSERYDAIVIGGGHNGLIAAAYLARAGRRVVVLERRSLLGGATVSEELFPDHRVPALADGAPRLPPEIARELGLAKLGLRLRRTDPLLVGPQLGGTCLEIWRDDDRTAARLADHSRADARRYPAFAARVRDLARVVAPVLAAPPPDVFGTDPADLLPVAAVAARARLQGRVVVEDLVRWITMSATDLADEWFEWEPLRAAVAASGIASISWGPSSAGTAATLLHGAVGDEGGAFGPGGVVVGGMGRLANTLAEAARRAGAAVRTQAPVARILTADDRVAGVVLEDGSELRAPSVLSSADPRTTFLGLLEPGTLDPAFVHDIGAIKYRGTTSRVHLALAGLPSFAAVPDPDLLRGRVRLLPSITYLERAYDDAKYGEPSAEPYLEATLPTLADPALAPDGRHLLSVTVRYTPYHLAKGSWADRGAALGDAVLERLELYAPGLGELVVDRHVITPVDLEEVYGLPEGNPNHGEHTLDQLLHMRPVPGFGHYRGPLDGLYLCGAGAHPGGGITGIPGRNAARQALRAGRRPARP